MRPRSFLTLILIGFMVVALPLFAALIASSVQVDRLAEQSQDALYKTVRVTQGGRILVEQVTSLERIARQFLVLRDKARLQAYKDTRREFLEMARQMLALNAGEVQSKQIQALLAEEEEIFAVLEAGEPGSAKSSSAVERFATLAEQARTILTESTGLVSQQVDVMRGMAEQAQRLLFWEASAMVPVAVVFAALFSVLISRPVRQVGRAIRRLGEGDFMAAIRVTGPRDLEQLGQQLDWLRTRLLELEEQKIQFLRHVSHELKTPLTAVREGAELLAEEVLGPLNEHQAEVAHILQHNTLRLQKLIEDLLAFNRQPEARGLALARKDVPLDRVVNEVLADYKLALRTKRIRIEAALEPVTLAGDADKLRTIVDNLLSNAIKYSPRSGVIRLSLARQAEEVTLEVQDQGPGIREADRGQVFDAFFQGELQPSGPVKGTGLGLAIVRDCVLAHGGKITIVDGPESGAHLRVSLPTTSEDLET